MHVSISMVRNMHASIADAGVFTLCIDLFTTRKDRVDGKQVEITIQLKSYLIVENRKKLKRTGSNMR